MLRIRTRPNSKNLQPNRKSKKARNPHFTSFPLSFPPLEKEKKLELEKKHMKRDSCLARVTAGAGIGAAVGAAVGSVYGTYEAVKYKVPGFHKIRHIGQTTLGSAAVFGLFLAAGSLLHCGK